MAITKTEGIVLRYTNLGEADKILTILTRNKGKIKAVAKGCRKPKSNMLASTELFAFSEFVLYKGTNLYQVTQAETREIFYNLRNDLLKLSYAVFFVDMADAVSEEELPSERLFMLLAKTLYYLAAGEIPVGIINEAYQLKIMDISGYRPSLQTCVRCGKDEPQGYKFDIEMGGVICKECEKLGTGIIKISPGTLETIRLLLNTEISRLNTIKIDNTIFNEVDKLVKRFVETHLDKHFKSLDFLNEIKNNNMK